jgi:hypothetical protein
VKKSNLIFSAKMHESMLEYFEKQVSVLKELDILVENGKRFRLTEIHPLLFVLVHAAESMIELVKKQYATEVVVITRSFLERSINLCYLLLCDEDDFTNYIEYSLQKAYRATCKKVDTLSLLGIDLAIKEPSELLSPMLKKYTRKSGKEIPKWTELSFSDRLSFVQEKTGNLFDAFTVSSCKNIYEDASEVSHGTLYGALFIIGIFEGARSPDAVSQFINYYLSIVFFNCSLLIDKLLHVIRDQKIIDVESLLLKSKENGKVAADSLNSLAK